MGSKRLSPHASTSRETMGWPLTRQVRYRTETLFRFSGFRTATAQHAIMRDRVLRAVQVRRCLTSRSRSAALRR